VADGCLHADGTFIASCVWYEQTSTVVLMLWYKERYSEPRPPSHSPTCRGFCFALTGVEMERDAPCSTLTLRLAYISASFVIPLYKALAYHVHIHLCHAGIPMAASICMTCVCSFMSDSTVLRTRIYLFDLVFKQEYSSKHGERPGPRAKPTAAQISSTLTHPND
jgi:hypothetical protein